MVVTIHWVMPETVRVCPQCRSRNPSWRRSCGSCSALLEGASLLEPVAPTVPVPRDVAYSERLSELLLGESWPAIECFRCGVCCARYRPRVTSEEMEHIAQELGIPTQVFISKYVRAIPQKGARVLQNDEDCCPFLSWDKDTNAGTCAIYAFRPQACRNWLASLSRPECREGLCKLGTADRNLLLDGLCSLRDEIERLCSALTNQGSTEPQQV